MRPFPIVKVLIVMISLLLLVAACSSSQDTGTTKEEAALDYPKEDINILVGYAPGGGTDTMARVMIQALNNNGIVDQTFQVENLPGASGVNAFIKMQKESDDDHQIMIVPEMGIPLVNGSFDAGYDDFIPVAQASTGTVAMVVGKNSPYETAEEVIEAIEKDPASVSISIPGALDSAEPYRWYTIFEEIGSDIELGDLNTIPTGGLSEVITSIVGEHTDVALLSASKGIVDQAEVGNMKVLAVLSPERLEQFPDTPTLVELGINIVHDKARGIWMGKDVPEEVVQYWEDVMSKIETTPEWQEYLEQEMLQATFKDSEAYLDFLKTEGESFGAYIKRIEENR
ncbi:Bug family tripartite tricarboxylate transporter substrate binding protein [Metabacillus arenae]|uniref:Tripartite tricarboxylate transporter substrate binding protein n=1 Tax=Metabacillus arenae TaxID=2771434 RepID=A0A926S295_9BACI|nr:tripartite tricarboxylate transporter substrate binding protein [Metabacillus arenae]MBD1381784.1 tripartite tricarboxylate transporter substrate binding protein [Metabacillus arenae]